MAAKRKRNRETAAGAEPESHANRNDTTRLLVLIFTAFAANMFIMTLELVAGRLVARFIGSSLYTWTTIVGGVLLGMAVGSYLGGRLADRHSPLKLLAVLLLLAGMACPSVLALNQIIGYAPFVRSLDWPPRIFVHVMFTFLIPCVFLGSVTPVILREALTIPIGTGRTIGLIYGASALGSVIGTFVAGFVLIPNMGTRMIVMLMGLGLGALAVYYAWSSQQQGAVRLRTTDSDGAGPVPTRGYSPALVSALGAVFVGNASFMVYELAASRLATQYLGHSIYTWTTLLGVVLAGIMLGNYLGGRWSDRYQPDVLLPWFFAASCLFALASLPLYRWLAQGVLLDNFMWSNRIVAQITLAFFVPSVAMGTIGPAAARKAIALSALPGHTVGLIYAAGSFASVVATFVTGYVLVDTLWPIGTIMLLSVVLAMSSFVWGPRSRAWVIAMPTLLFALILAVTPNPAVQQFAGAVGLREQDGPDFVFRDHSQYSWIAVTASPLDVSERKLYLDQLLHSTADIDAPLTLEYEYEQIYNGVLSAYYPEDRPIRANVLGGGGYVYPRYLELTRPNSYIETVEIDPAVTEAAHAGFGLPRDTTIAIYEMDARNRIEDLVREGGEKYDCIFGDSFNQYSVPFQLTTLEFTHHLHDLLTEDGIYFMNIIESMQRGAFLGSVVRTMRLVFPYVYAIRTDDADTIRDTFVILGAKRQLDLEPVIRSLRIKGFEGGVLLESEIAEIIERNDCPVLTDDFAPVDNMVGPLINTRQSSRAVEIRRRAIELLGTDDLDEALPLLETLHTMEPWDLEVVRDLALLYGRQGNLEKAEPYFEKAVQMDPSNHEFHYNLGLLYSQTNRDEEALEQFQLAFSLRPDYTVAAFALGAALNAAGRNEEAVAPLEAGTRLDPGNASGHVLLANTLATLRRFDEAKREFEAAIAIAPDFPGARENLARVHLNLEDYSAAREQYVRILENDPRNPVILYLFGVTLEAEGMPGQAVNYYELALDIDPGFEDARAALERALDASESLDPAAP